MTLPLLLPFAGTQPVLLGAPAFAGPRCAVLGRATIGTGATFGEDCVVRADGHTVTFGEGIHLGHRATVHISHDLYATTVGANVTVGANAVVHACTIGDGCVIEDDVVVLDGATVGAGALIEGGSTVFMRKRLEGGKVYAGSPAKPVRAVEPGELAARAAAIRARRGSERALSPNMQDFGNAVFVAETAQRAGRLTCAPGSSLFFSAVADAGSGTIFVGERTNVQDNTIIRAGAGETIIGRDTTVGHNVRMGAARIGDGTLVGMGAVLAEGTWVQDDVLLAAGATTEPGQVLETGWLWAGRPAKAMAKLDDAKRAMMREGVAVYCEYSQAFRRIQQETLRRTEA